MHYFLLINLRKTVQIRIKKLYKEGELLISNQHYAVDCIKPKYEEIKRKNDYIKKEFQAKLDETNQALDVVSKIEKVVLFLNVVKIIEYQVY